MDSAKEQTEVNYRIYADEKEQLPNAAVSQYQAGICRRSLLLLGLGGAILVCVVIGLLWGNRQLPAGEVLWAFLTHNTTSLAGTYVWRIDLPIITAAVLVGAGLSLSGVVMQCLLRNPLASPYTLGLSSAASFGAALSVILFNGGAVFAHGFLQAYCTPICAFACALLATGLVLALTKLTRVAPETMVLAGIAISAIFTAGLTLLQYLADPVQMSAIVSWTFGSVSYTSWSWDLVLFAVLVPATAYFLYRCWDLNAVSAGDEVARGLGVNTNRLLVIGMMLSALLASVMVARFGVIAFVGLLGPHLARLLIGNDYRLLVPGGMLTGALLMIIANTLALNIVRPMILPVGLLTSLLGGPAFIYLLLRRYRR